MDIQETGFTGFIDQLKQNPVMLGLIVVVLGAIIYVLSRTVNKSGVAAPVTDNANPAVPIVYNNTYNTYPTVLPPPAGSPPNTPPVHIPTPGSPPVPIVVQPTPPPKPAPKYFTVTVWPKPGSSLWSISQIVHVGLSTIEALNPQIKNVNLVYPGQQVRYA